MPSVWHYLFPTDTDYCGCAVGKECWEHNPSWHLPDSVYEETDTWCPSWTERDCGKFHELVDLKVFVGNIFN